MSITSTSLHTSSLLPSRHAQMISQTYSLAHMARRKLAREASRPDLHLSRLVGHANLLDSLMLELGNAEREQQQWINSHYQETNKAQTSPRHIQWADCVVVEEEPEEDWQVSDTESDADSDYDQNEQVESETENETELEADVVSLQRVSSHQILTNVSNTFTTSKAATTITCHSIPRESDYEIDDFQVLQLEFSSSNSAVDTTPELTPELDHDSDSSEDEAMPPSPSSNSTLFFENNSSDISYSPKINPYDDDTPKETPDNYECGFYFSQATNDIIPTINVY